MKEHVLNPSDRAALQALVPLAGALGAGTIFALFFGGRRRAGFAVFELFTIVAVFTAVGSTAYFSIALLHQNEAISGHDLTQTATPLLVAAILLIFVSAFSRLPGSVTHLVTLLPITFGAIVIAVLLASFTWSAQPESIILLAVAILAVGAAVGVLAWWGERIDIGWDRRWEHRRLTRLYAAGYVPDEKPLRLALPRPEQAGRVNEISCWTRKGRAYLDLPTGWHLRAEVHRLWREQAVGEARPPVGSVILVRTQIWPRIPLLRKEARLGLHLLEPSRGGEASLVELEPNDDGVFDVTGLGVV